MELLSSFPLRTAIPPGGDFKHSVRRFRRALLKNPATRHLAKALHSAIFFMAIAKLRRHAVAPLTKVDKVFTQPEAYFMQLKRSTRMWLQNFEEYRTEDIEKLKEFALQKVEASFRRNGEDIGRYARPMRSHVLEQFIHFYVSTNRLGPDKVKAASASSAKAEAKKRALYKKYEGYFIVIERLQASHLAAQYNTDFFCPESWRLEPREDR